MATIGDLILNLRVNGGNQAASTMTNLGSRIQKFGASVSNVGKTLTNSLTKPILGLIAQSIKLAVTFEQQMSRVQAASDSTGQEIETLRKLALKMGINTTKTSTQAAEAMEHMAKAGWDVAKIQKGIEPILRASEAGMMDLGLTSNLVTKSMGALGIGVKDISRYLDIAAKSSSSSEQTLREFLEAMQIAGGAFKEFKVPLEESGALLAGLAKRGFTGTKAGHALITVLKRLTVKSGESGKAMKSLNVEVYDSHGNFRGFTTILQDLNKKFSTMTDEQRLTYLQMLGGARRSKELSALLSAAKGELTGFTKELYNADGSLNKMAKTMQANLAGEVTRLGSVLEGIGIMIGDKFTPIIKIVVDVLKDLANKFLNLDPTIQNIILGVGLAVAAIGPLVTIFGFLITSVGAVIASLGVIGGVISSIGLPITIVIGVIGTLIAAFVGMLATSEDVRSKIVTAFNVIGTGIQQAAGFIKTHITDIKNAVIGFFQAISTGDTTTFKNALMNMVPPELKGTIDNIAIGLQDFWLMVTKVKDVVVGFVEGALKTMTPVVNEIIATFQSFDINTIVLSFQQLGASLGPVLEFLGALATLILGILIGAINGVINALDNFIAMLANAVGVITSVFGIIWNTITGNMEGVEESWNNLWINMQGVLGNAIQTIIDLVGGFINGIVTFFVSLYETLVGGSIIPDMVNAIVEWFNNLVSFVTGIVQGFVNIVTTLFNAMKNNASNVFNAMKAVITTVINVIKTVITTGFNAAKTIVTTVVNAIKSVVSSGFNVARSIISSVINAIKSVISSGFNAARSIVSSVISSIRSTVSSGFNSARSIISGAVNSARSALSGAFNSMRSTVSSVVSSITSKVNTLRSKFSSAVSGAVSAIKGAASRMFSAGANLVGNLIRGVTSKIAAFKAKVGELAQAAKNFIGWESPTKEGPGKTADKWIPNLIDMMVGGLDNGVSRFAKAGSNLAGALQRSTMTGIETNINARIPQGITAAPNNVTFKIDASHMDVDQLGRMLVSKFRSYGIRSQTE